MSRLMIAMLVSAGAGWAGVALAQTSSPPIDQAPLTKAGYTQAIKDAEARYTSARNRCASLAGNAKDICAAEAKGSRSVAKADAEAAYKPTPKAREEARIARADATYQVAIERCDDLAGNPKDVCVKEAKSGLVNGRANAKVDRVAADTSRAAAATQAEARKEAHEDKREAELKVAIEKCEVLSGAPKDACVRSAKAQYGRN